jgi:hypothetical protein
MEAKMAFATGFGVAGSWAMRDISARIFSNEMPSGWGGMQNLAAGFGDSTVCIKSLKTYGVSWQWQQEF